MCDLKSRPTKTSLLKKKNVHETLGDKNDNPGMDPNVFLQLAKRTEMLEIQAKSQARLSKYNGTEVNIFKLENHPQKGAQGADITGASSPFLKTLQ